MVILPTHWFIPIQSIQNIFTYIITVTLGDVESRLPQYHQYMIRQSWVSCFDTVSEGFSGCSDDKESACNAGDLGWIPGWARSPGEENGNHSSILAWRIPWTEESGGLPSKGCKESDTTEQLTLTQQHRGMKVSLEFIEHWKSGLRQVFQCRETWLGLERITICPGLVRKARWWFWDEWFKEHQSTNYLFMLSIKELMGLLARSYNKQIILEK